MQVAHALTAVDFAWRLTQDGAGGFEFAGNAFPMDPVLQKVAYLKKVLASWLPCFPLESLELQ